MLQTPPLFSGFGDLEGSPRGTRFLSCSLPSSVRRLVLGERRETRSRSRRQGQRSDPVLTAPAVLFRSLRLFINAESHSCISCAPNTVYHSRTMKPAGGKNSAMKHALPIITTWHFFHPDSIYREMTRAWGGQGGGGFPKR